MAWNYRLSHLFTAIFAYTVALTFIAWSDDGDFGKSEIFGEATGFYHTQEIKGAVWMVDPAGRATTFLGIDHVRPLSWKDRTLGFDVYDRFVETNYPTKEAWLDETLGRLGDWGFNTLANHCDEPLLRHRGLAHTITLYLGGKFARGNDPDRWITKWTGPCTGFPNVFHPDFEREMHKQAQELCAPHRNDPDLAGWFLDNELKWWGAADKARKDLTLFDTIRTLPPEHSARKALEEFAAEWEKGRDARRATGDAQKGEAAESPLACRASRVACPSPSDANALREAFLRLVAERYFSVLCDAIREADPNHMILGCRFAAPFTSAHPVVWDAAGKYCDVVSLNCYPWVDIDRGVVLEYKGGVPVADRFRDVHRWCGKPLVVTEWSFPALDTGRPCYYGAGQRFPTQGGRAAATALYARTMLSLPFVVGYSYFMFLDQPKSGISESFREDSNYGLINEFGKPYEAVTAALRKVQSAAMVIHNGSCRAGTRRCEEREDVCEVADDAQPTFDSRHPTTGFRHSTSDGSWSLTNAFARLESASPSERPRLSFCGVEVGGLGALLQWRGPDGDVWTHAADYALLDQTPFTTTIRAVGGEEVRFAIAIRISLTPGARLIDAEILSVENVGDEQFQFSGVFFVPMPPTGAEPQSVVPNLWGAPERAWWRNPDGIIWGIASDSPTAAFHFWNSPHGKKESTFHADARFTTGSAPVTLAPGETWRPPFPMRAWIGLRGDFPGVCKQY